MVITILMWVVMLPFLCWVWWGFVFITVKYAILIGWQETGDDMKEETVEYPARLIRYAKLADASHPNLLSAYDKEKNLQLIDYDLSLQLPEAMRNRLEMSTIPATMIVDDGHGLRFGEYRQ